jgi:hypothetical protein
VIFEGVGLRGAPHFVALDEKGDTRYVFLYPSKWKPHELKSYLHPLSIIVEGRYEGTTDQIWCMDLKAGKTVKFKRTARLSAAVRTLQGTTCDWHRTSPLRRSAKVMEEI